VRETGEITFFGLAIEDPPPVIERFLSRVVGDTFDGRLHSSRNVGAARAASLSPVIVIARSLGFKQGFSGAAVGVAAGNEVAVRNTEGWGVLDRGMTGGRGGCHGVLGRFGDKASPLSVSGNETLVIFGVGG